MSNLIYRRMAGYVFAICLHCINSAVIRSTLLPPKNENLREVEALMWQYFTIWNVCFQIIYSLFGLTCDILTLANSSEKISGLISLREKIFSYVMWTSGFLVATIFWPMYLYDRSLLYPEFIDEGIPPRCNYVLHGWIILVLLWEFLHLPRNEKIYHKTGVMIVSVEFACYFSWICYSYSVNGLWPYPFLKMSYGTIYFPVIMLVIYAIVMLSYFHQWPLVHLVWGKSVNKDD